MSGEETILARRARLSQVPRAVRTAQTKPSYPIMAKTLTMQKCEACKVRKVIGITKLLSSFLTLLDSL